MNIVILALTFLAGVAVAACVVLTFAGPIDGTLLRLSSGETQAAWSLYAKFALFVASLSGGLRLRELSAYSSAATRPAADAGQCLLEVFKTVVGSLGAASELLLVFFVSTLAAHAGKGVYEALRTQSKSQRADEPRQPVPGGRF